MRSATAVAVFLLAVFLCCCRSCCLRTHSCGGRISAPCWARWVISAAVWVQFEQCILKAAGFLLWFAYRCLWWQNFSSLWARLVTSTDIQFQIAVRPGRKQLSRQLCVQACHGAVWLHFGKPQMQPPHTPGFCNQHKSVLDNQQLARSHVPDILHILSCPVMSRPVPSRPVLPIPFAAVLRSPAVTSCHAAAQAQTGRP